MKLHKVNLTNLCANYSRRSKWKIIVIEIIITIMMRIMIFEAMKGANLAEHL